ncbi:MAG: aldehyde dehydrogenase [Myxococcales bacterium]|nr:aldehyde dehydrogenase [Myxococcales bacterium]
MTVVPSLVPSATPRSKTPGAPAIPRGQNLIGGGFCDARDGATLPVIDPARDRLLTTIPASGAADVDAAVAAARDAFPAWSASATAERADLLDAVADAIERRLGELALLESLDNGKPVSLARAVDIPRAVANFRFFAGAVRHQQTACHPMDGDALNYTLRRPVGVFGLITPWNLPLYLLSWKVAPALAMGNTVVAKPSELTPLTATALAGILQELGAPAGVFNLVHGRGHEAGQAIVEHPDVRGVSFTGGTATGARVAAAAAPMFKKLSLELGGKNPTLVFADCELDEAVRGAARAGFANQGQICLCGSRILVERPIYRRFVDALVEEARARTPGDPQDPATGFGALVSAAHRDKVARYVALARRDGGVLLCGGRAPELPGELARGAFYEPTVIDGLSPASETATEEIFGPVVTVHPFDDEREAVRLANCVRYGLAASLWTRDLARAHRVSAQLASGMVWVNTWLLRDLRVPFGGMKDSGVGREGGRFSLEFFSESRNICIKL